MWKKIWKAIADFFAPKIEKKVSPAIPQQATPSAQQVIWAGYECLDFLRHGDSQENQNRENAIKSAVAGGFDCIVMELRNALPTDLSIHLLHWESDKEKGKFLRGNWWEKARNAGVTKWVVIVKISDADWICDRFKAYEPNTLQLVIGDAELMKRVAKDLGLDANGIKTSAPKYR